MVKPIYSAILLFLALLCTGSYAGADALPEVTEGAAAGYVQDKVCRDCHVSIYDSYQHVGMAQSFKHPANATEIEAFGETFYHAPSRRYYQINKEGDALTFRRYQEDEQGNVHNEIVLPVHWVLGSGNRTRSYLHHTEHGEIFQLPIGWYTEDQKWEMSPGFEAPDHKGLAREVTRNCLFCHNAFPEVATDSYGDVSRFPKTLPEGTGCQRCHGPGGQHVSAALTGSSLEVLRAHIVNPRKLEGEAQDSVCMQCHLLPSVSIVSPLQFGRGEFSFRPGELLSDFVVQLDVREAGIEEPERFEINHHGYRLMKSECYQQAGLTCIDCHNPHVKPPSDEFREKVAGVCQDCHGDVQHQTQVSQTACVSCHMPTRRTQDVVHVTMTDHWIAKGPFDLEALVAPIEVERRAVSNIKPLGFGASPDRADAQALIAISAMRANRSVEQAVRSLIQVLRQKEYEHYTPYLDLARAWLKLGQFQQAESAAKGLIRGDDSLVVAYDILGIAQLALGKYEQAKLTFKKSLALQPAPEVHLALATAYFETSQLTLAELEVDKAISLRPLLAEGYRLKGRIDLRQDRGEKAARDFERSLQIEPGHRATYGLMAKALSLQGDTEAASRYLALADLLVPAGSE